MATWDDVRSDELKAINKRRLIAGFRPPRTNASADDPSTLEPSDAIGLALSGGGVRSAAFNLGVVQALHRFGIFRYCDYLSSVSGGSYVAGAIADSVSRESQPYSEANFAFAPKTLGQQPERVKRIAERGNYLFRLDLFASPYLWGLCVNLLPWLSLIAAFGAGTAWLWRCLDLHFVRDHLEALGLRGDFWPALLPALAATATWLIVGTFALWLQSRPLSRASRLLFWISVAMFAIAAAVLLGNGDIAVARPAKRGEENGVIWQEHLRVPLAILAGIGLLPLLTPRRLIRSGAAPSSYAESWVFYYTSFVLFLGIPLLAVAWFSRENVSGFATQRGPDLVYGDVKDIRAFCELVNPNPAVESTSVVVNMPSLQARATFLVPEDLVSSPVKTAAQTTKEEAASIASLAEQVVIAGEQQDAAEYVLHLRSTYPPLEVNKGEGLADIVEREWQAHNNASPSMRWIRWRYLGFFERWRQFAAGVFLRHAESDAYHLLSAKRSARDAEIRLLDKFNRTVLGEQLFKVNSTSSWLGRFSGPQQLSGAVIVASLPSRIQELVRQSLIDRTSTLADSREQKELNRALLEAAFPEIVRPRTDLRRASLISYDQFHRAVWFAGSLTMFFLASIVIRDDATSIHEYYRDRLAYAFLDQDDERRLDGGVPLANCRPDRKGAPYPLVGAATVPRLTWDSVPDQLEPATKSYLLSPMYCGSKDLGYAETDTLAAAKVTVPDAMAISGAALSPNYFVHHIVVAIASLLNLRTGKWFPTPNLFDKIRRGPSMMALIVDSLLRGRDNRPRRYTLVTDGGHAENLGLQALLDRGCRLIVVSDAARDASMCFDDLARLVRRVRPDAGIELIDILDDAPLCVGNKFPVRTPPDGVSKQLDKVRATQEVQRKTVEVSSVHSNHQSDRHCFFGRLRYRSPANQEGSLNPEGSLIEALLVYIKPCLTGDEGVALYNYAVGNPLFPHDPTADQAFSRSQFWSYLELGYHSGCDACSALGLPEERSPLWSDTVRRDVDDLADLLSRGAWSATAFQRNRSTTNRAQSDARWRIATILKERDATKALRKLKKLGERAIDAVDLLLEAIVDNHPLAMAFESVIKEWGCKAYHSLALYASSSTAQQAAAMEGVIYLKVFTLQWKPVRTTVAALCKAALPESALSSDVRGEIVHLLEVIAQTHLGAAAWIAPTLEACRVSRQRIIENVDDIRQAFSKS